MAKITRRKVLFIGLAAGAAVAIAGGASALPLVEHSSNAKVQIVGGQSPGVRYKITYTFSDYAHYANTRDCSGPINTYPERTSITHTHGPIRGIIQEGKNYILIGSQSDGVTEHRARLNNANRIAACITKDMVLLEVIVTPD
ncbi:MAG: hypothetical protein ACFB14_20885 [Leptolyngbyaceae cyanobacterium]